MTEQELQAQQELMGQMINAHYTDPDWHEQAHPNCPLCNQTEPDYEQEYALDVFTN